MHTQSSGCSFNQPFPAQTQDLISCHVRIPANVTGHSGDRDRFAHGHHAGVSFVL